MPWDDAGPTRRMLLFGGTRGTGFEVGRLARARSWEVVALARPKSAFDGLTALGCTVVIGDALEPHDVRAMARTHGQGAVVVSTLGGGPVGRSADCWGVMTVVDAMVIAGVRRLVLVSSLGAGDSRAFASDKLIAAIGAVLEEKTRAEAYAIGAGLDLTILRPGGLLSTPATGGGALFDTPRVHGRIARADLAHLILDCLDTPASIGRTLSAVDRSTVSGPPDPVELIPARLARPACVGP